MSEELKILIEGMRDDIKLVAEGVYMLNSKFDRFEEENRKDHEGFQQSILHVEADVSILKKDVAVLKEDVSVLKTDVAVLKEDVASLKTDMNEHRNNTELHTVHKAIS